MNILAFPFRIDETGRVAHVLQNSPEHHRQVIATLMLTGEGERDMAPSLGIAGMAFDQFARTLLERQLAEVRPAIRITETKTDFTSDDTQQVRIYFTSEEV